jgi:hypothetical protein
MIYLPSKVKVYVTPSDLYLDQRVLHTTHDRTGAGRKFTEPLHGDSAKDAVAVHGCSRT